MNRELLDRLAELDAAGFLIGAEESADDFLRRVEETEKVHASFEEELAKGEPVEVFDLFKVRSECRIPPDFFDEAAQITRNLYGFAVRRVPGFFLTKQVGLLWGGCLIGDPEAHFAVFLLRDAFRRRRRFLNYRREELMAHELCHSARHVMCEPVLEEYFAYQTSPSFLRRYLGNCFISDRDAWLFLLPVMLLPPAELIRALWIPGFPSWIFWVLAAVYPLYLLIRNALSRRLAGKAREVLEKAGVERPAAVLFRCTLPELRELGRCAPAEIFPLAERRAAVSPRWAVMLARFFRPEPAEAPSGGASSQPREITSNEN